jgi:hypothetical protein
MLSCPDHQAFARGIDNRRRHSEELIDFQNASDLREQPMKQAEIPAGYADDGGQTFVVKTLYGQMYAFRGPGSL